MNTLKDLLKNNIVAFGLVLACAWIVSSFVLANGLATINSHNAISVTGTAERIVESDVAKWTFVVTRESSPQEYAYALKQLKVSQGVMKKYLINQGIDEKEIRIEPVVSNKVCQSQKDIIYGGITGDSCSGYFTYMHHQSITVESDKVSLVDSLSQRSQDVDLLGSMVNNSSVSFFYTKLTDIRATLLEEASKNAKERAQAIAKSTGSRVGGVKDASQGVFQVTQKNSTDVSDYGSYDTSTIEKKITAIVRASFEVR
jgi:uncharacterized protein